MTLCSMIGDFLHLEAETNVSEWNGSSSEAKDHPQDRSSGLSRWRLGPKLRFATNQA